MIKKIILLFLFLIPMQLFAALETNADIDLQNIALPDALRLIAKFIHRNVVISPTVQGTVNLHVKRMQLAKSFDFILLSHGLVEWQVGNVWLIATHDELMKRKREEVKWQEINEDASSLVTKVWQIHYAKADDLAKILQNGSRSLLSKRGHVSVDARTNILCVRDIVERISEIERVISKLDVPVQQILIEARIASVDNDFERELGLQFSSQNTSHPATTPNWNMNATPAPRGQYNFALATLANGSSLDLKLSALESQGHARLISSPSLFTANQQAASIEAGEEIPYQEVSRSGATTVVFKKAALSLKVIPQIMPNNRVLLRLQVNQDKPSSHMVLGVPTISTRQIMTSVLLKNGQTIVLGGIYEANSEEGEEGLPFINRIPLLGSLLQQHNTRVRRRELLVFVTPKIIAVPE